MYVLISILFISSSNLPFKTNVIEQFDDYNKCMNQLEKTMVNVLENKKNWTANYTSKGLGQSIVVTHHELSDDIIIYTCAEPTK